MGDTAGFPDYYYSCLTWINSHTAMNSLFFMTCTPMLTLK